MNHLIVSFSAVMLMGSLSYGLEVIDPKNPLGSSAPAPVVAPSTPVVTAPAPVPAPSVPEVTAPAPVPPVVMAPSSGESEDADKEHHGHKRHPVNFGAIVSAEAHRVHSEGLQGAHHRESADGEHHEHEAKSSASSGSEVEHAERPEHPERTERVEHNERHDRPERAERPERNERGTGSEGAGSGGKSHGHGN